MDRTVTSLGARLLADWLAAPLVDVAAIDARLDAVAELVADAALTAELRDALAADLRHPAAAGPRDHRPGQPARFELRRPHAGDPAEGEGQAHRPHQRAACSNSKQRLDLCADVRGPLEQALVDDCPLVARDGGFIRAGYRVDLDELRELTAGGKQWMAEYQAAECQRTGIPNIKVGFNSVFGYYLEITHAHRDKIPADYIRKQTVKNAERYITPELKEYEEKVLTAEERAKELEYDLFVAAARAGRGRRGPRCRPPPTPWPKSTCSPASPSWPARANYVRPTVVAEPVLDVEAGRHPVLDVTEPDGTFVPNGICSAQRECEAAERASAIRTRFPAPDLSSSPARTWPARAPTSARRRSSR